MRLTFVQLRTFVADAARLGLTDDDLGALETVLIEHPTAGSVMRGTGGLREAAVCSATHLWRQERRDSRVLRLFPGLRSRVLVVAFAKNEQPNLSARQKSQIRSLLREIHNYLSRSGK